MPTLAVFKFLSHFRFIPLNKMDGFLARLLENGWIPEDDDPRLDNKTYRKLSPADKNHYMQWPRHIKVTLFKNPTNYGCVFKHYCDLGFRTITDEELEIEREQEQGIYRINERMRNTENNRIALFTRSHHVMAFDADYSSGNYEDNGESVERSHAWNWELWESVK